MDLNTENGVLEIPIRPTIRIGTPIYQNSKFLGMLILNLDLEVFLRILMVSSLNDIYLVDKDGEILVASKERLNWSRYLNKKDKIQNIFQQEEILLSGNRNVQNNIYMFKLENIVPNNEALQLIVAPKNELVEKLFQQNIENGIYISIIVFLIAIPLAYLTSMFPSRLHEKLQKSLNELQEKSEIIDKYVIFSTTDVYGRIEFASKAFLEKTEFHSYELLGHKHSLLRNPEQTKDFYEELWETIVKGGIWHGEIKNLTKNQKDIWFEETIIPRKNEQNEIIGFTSIANDITDKKRIELLSITDPLTQIYNRLKLDEVLEKEIYSANRYNYRLSVILIDIDKFKSVNDTYGHQVGDSVLVELSNLVVNSVRKSDIFGRWGGEEFLLILPQTDLKNAVLFAEKLRRKVENFDFSVIGTKTASFGVSSFVGGDSKDSLVKRADELLYQAKENGRNRVESVLEEKPKEKKYSEAK